MTVLSDMKVIKYLYFDNFEVLCILLSGSGNKINAVDEASGIRHTKGYETLNNTTIEPSYLRRQNENQAGTRRIIAA